MADTKMQDDPSADVMSTEPMFSDEEKDILDLYDQVQDLELEFALTKARSRLAEKQSHKSNRGPSAAEAETDADPQALKASRDQLLEAMALYRLRNTVTNSVLIANPILRGIHNSAYASPVEQDLPRLVAARDDTAKSVAATSEELRASLDRLSEVEVEVLRVRARNRELAAEVLRLVAEVGRGRDEAIAADEGARAQVELLESRLASSRQKWRVVKGTTAGIVAGSGVDWAGDEVLRDLVLDPE